MPQPSGRADTRISGAASVESLAMRSAAQPAYSLPALFHFAFFFLCKVRFIPQIRFTSAAKRALYFE